MSPKARQKLDEALYYLMELQKQCSQVNSGNLSHHIARIHASAQYSYILVKEAKESDDEAQQQENG